MLRARRHRGTSFERLVQVFARGLKWVGMYERGVRNAAAVGLTRLEFEFADLPPDFDGFTILQLSDLHFDVLPETTRAAIELVSSLDADICAFTGDYRGDFGLPHEHVLPMLDDLLGAIRIRDRVFAIFGNHDCAGMVAPFRARGITVLINETLHLERGVSRLGITGTNDWGYRRSTGVPGALEAAPNGFNIALVHTPEFADVAADCGYRLYLAGHTHGGQIALPGGRPIFTNLRRFRRYASGLWRHDEMLGYTSTGVGVSLLPVRFNTRGEIVLITLRRADPR